jgi:hypothetical protein
VACYRVIFTFTFLRNVHKFLSTWCPIPGGCNLHFIIVAECMKLKITPPEHAACTVKQPENSTSTIKASNIHLAFRIRTYRQLLKFAFESSLQSSQNQCKPENCALLGYYAASSCNFLPTFRHNLSVPSTEVKKPKV